MGTAALGSFCECGARSRAKGIRRWLETLEKEAENSALHVRLKLPNKILVPALLPGALFSVVCVPMPVERVKPNLGLSFIIVYRENKAY